MILTESILAPLGSRFSVNFRPHRRDVRVSALGRFLDFVAELEVGIRLEDGQQRALPFTSSQPVFEYCEQELTANSITFRARSVPLACLLEVTFTSPFYPQDVQLSTAPFFYIDARVSRIPSMVHWESVSAATPLRGEFYFRMRRPGAAVTEDDTGVTWEMRLPLREHNMAPDPDLSQASVEDLDAGVGAVERLEVLHGGCRPCPGGVVFPFDLEAGALYCSLVWAAYVGDPVLEDMGTPTVFRYTEDFADVHAVVAYAREAESDIRQRSAFFDSLLLESSLGKTQCDFIAYALQSYLSNTWWTTRPDGTHWFSVWEGVCLFNSTIDVEYNVALLYLALWPELLEKSFEEWERHEQPGGFLSHDMGGGVRANGQSYPHHMEVEENCNFILMLHAYWRWTGSDAALRRHWELVKRLLAYLERSDTTGNGFPDQGIANTIDDASAAIQYSREQTYLGVKCLCAFTAGADIAEHLADDELASRCSARAELIKRTLDDEAWLGDHYAVCLDKQSDNLTDVWDRSTLPPGELEGWDAYSLYTSNGMLYPLMVGLELPLDIERIREDLANSLEESLTEYGCTHSSADRSNLWVSQNLWRDFVGAYLGVDCGSMIDRYWAFELLANTQTYGKCFIDTYAANNLCYYPRGITSIGALIAYLGMQLDRVNGVMRIQPVRVPCRLPLLPLADWRNGVVPWVEFWPEQGEVMAEIEGDMPEGLAVEIGRDVVSEPTART